MKTLLGAAAAAITLFAGCAGLPAAQMQLPEALAGGTAETVQGIGGGREGGFVLSGLTGRFERSASRLSLFDAVGFDRAAVRYRSTPASGAPVAADCSARQTTASVGIVAAAPRPFELRCGFSGGLEGELQLGERSGRVAAAGVTLDLQPVYRVKGSPLPLQAPIGYVFTRQGQAVGAVELNGNPRLWRPPADTPAHAAVTHAALALALLWRPDGP